MNKREKMILLVILAAMCIVVAFLGITRAEPITEEVSVEDGMLVVREVEMVKTETARYAIPPFDVPVAYLLKIREIMERGEGEYTLKHKTKKTWQWGFPMRSVEREITTVSAFQDGAWSEPKIVTGPETTANDWGITALLAAIAISVLFASVAHQKSGKSEWLLLAYYAALGVAVIGGVINNPIIAAITAIITASITAFITAIITAFITAFIAAIITAFAAIITAIITALAFAGQQIEYAIFMACVIVASYAIAKLAKHLGWIKVMEKPATPA